MIKEIHIKNFKSLKNVKITCQNFNILTGMNGMGKSTLIQALLLLRQSHLKGFLTKTAKTLYLGEDTEKGDLVVMGNYEDIIYQDFEEKEPYLQFSISFSDNKQGSIKTENYGYDIKTNLENQGYNVIAISHDFQKNIFEESIFQKNKFQYIQANRIANQNELPKNNLSVQHKNFGIDGRYAMHYFVTNRAKPIPIPALSFPSKNIDLSLESQINAWLGEISPNVQVASIDEENATSIEQKYSFSIGAIPRKPFKAFNVGFGISYTFSVILALLTAEKGDLIIIENPEAHLHPKGQSKITELMALAAQNGVQIFCETHSDHVFNASRLCAKKQIIDAEKIALYYFTKKQDYSEAIQIKIDENGGINKRPKGLFDEWGIILDQLID